MTLSATPAAYSSVNDALVYTASDAHAADPVTYVNYKYVYEVYINGTLEFTGKVMPNPATGYGIFDIGNIVRGYVAASLAPTGSGILAQELGEGAFSVSVVVKLREEYGGTLGAVVHTDSPRVYFNHYNGRTAGTSAISSLTAKPLTVRDTTFDLLFTNNNFYLPYFSATTTPFTVVITGGTATRTKTITPTAANTLQVLNISPGAINTDYSGNFTSASTGYTVAVGGVTYTVRIICTGNYTNYPVHFLNKYGGFETMLFNKARKKTFDIERKDYQQAGYRVDGSGTVTFKTGSIMHEQQTSFAIKFKEKLRIYTDLLSDTDFQWLAQLVTSPLVYLEDSEVLYPVVMAATNYEQCEHIVDGTKSLGIDLNFGTAYKTQSR